VALFTATPSADNYIRVYPDLIELASILADGGRKIVDTPAGYRATDPRSTNHRREHAATCAPAAPHVR
jgi:hypothetical protein